MTYDQLIEQFTQWQQAARDRNEIEPSAMALATSGDSGQPHVRMVLLKGVDRQGFVFYTNLGSDKADQLAANRLASLCFHFKTLERQVRVEGVVEQVGDDEADAYFATRSRGSQIGAWASRQSRQLTSRGELERLVKDTEKRFEDQQVPRPPFWSGYRLKPTMIEFWQGQPDRLHDRIRYLLKEGRWHSSRLFP